MGTSCRRCAGRLSFITGHPEHGVRLLVVSLEPCQDGLRRVRGDHDLKSALGDPSPNEGTKKIGLTTAMGPGPVRNIAPGLAAPPPHRETQSTEDATRLMRVEVRPVQARHKTDHLLRRKTLAGHNDVVVIQRLRHLTRKSPLDRDSIQGKHLPSDDRLYLSHTYCIALTEPYHKVFRQEALMKQSK